MQNLFQGCTVKAQNKVDFSNNKQKELGKLVAQLQIESCKNSRNIETSPYMIKKHKEREQQNNAKKKQYKIVRSSKSKILLEDTEQTLNIAQLKLSEDRQRCKLNRKEGWKIPKTIQEKF